MPSSRSARIRGLLVALALLASSATSQRVLRIASGDSAGDRFGYRVRAAGDVDADGVADMIVASQGASLYVRVVSGRTGLAIHTIRGLSSGDRFGYAVSGAGDVDNDGYGDFLISSPSRVVNSNRGEVEVYSGRTGLLLDRMSRHNLNSIGEDLCAVGDVDNDGHDDFAFTSSGNVLLASGKTGAIMRLYPSGSSGSGRHPAVRGAGDVDNDGAPDLVVGDPNANNAKGRAVIYSSRTGIPLQTLIANTQNNDALAGTSVDGLGDVDGDGTPDVIVGFPNEANASSFAGGAIRVYSGKTGRTLLTVFNPSESGNFGSSVCAAGDVNFDGTPDFAVSSSYEVFVYSGRSGRMLNRLSGFAPEFQLAWGIDSLPDIDNDGVRELVIGEPFSSRTTLRAGSAIIVGGRVLASVVVAGKGCAGSSEVPSLHSERPVLGRSVSVWGRNAATALPGVVLLGAEVTTPINLGALGCDLYVNPLGMFVLFGVSGATWSRNFPVSADPTLHGVELMLQAVHVSKTNAIGLDLSNGLRWRLGS